MGTVWDAALKLVPQRWVVMAAPAVVFWAGAVLAWITAGWAWLEGLIVWLNGQATIVQLAVGLVAVMASAASVIVVRRVTTPVLRLLEGYWPVWLEGFSQRRWKKIRQDKAADDKSWQHLQQQIYAQVLADRETTPKQFADLARLEARRRHRPVLDGELLPTRTGNILRAAETRPGHRYGLNTVALWPRLWLVLPEATRSELTDARAGLDAAVAAAIWGMAFVVFTLWAWWAAPVGAAVAVAAIVWWVPERAETFADLIEAAVDMYRVEVYRQLRWPLPTCPAEEHASGEALTRYLFRGSTQAWPLFTPPRKD